VDQDRLIATRNPMLGNLGREEKLTAFIQRKYDHFPVGDGEKIRLRGADRAQEYTDWEAETTLVGKPEEMKLSLFLARIGSADPEDRAWTNQIVQECGYGDVGHLQAEIQAQFTGFDERPDPSQSVVLFRVATPERIIHRTTHAPRACMERSNAPGAVHAVRAATQALAKLFTELAAAKAGQAEEIDQPSPPPAQSSQGGLAPGGLAP
jgi:hypothetical protein